jgi:syntaxin-binding protein 1
MIGSVGDREEWKVLIVDEESMHIISTCCRMYDVMERGVTVVENVMVNRQPLSKLQAIYFLSPTEESVAHLINDFDPKKKSKVMYAGVHLFFTTRVPDSLFLKLKKAPVHARIRQFKELNLDFLAPESQLFHFDMPDSLCQLFSPRGNKEEEIQRIAKKLVSVCCTLSEYPLIRYSRTPVATALANAVSTAFDDLSSAESEQLAKKVDDRTTLLILDRTLDPVAPVLHEFTYQAMIFDLIDIKKDCTYEYTYNNGTKEIKKEVLLDEHDFLWPKLRHMHIADCINKVIEDFNAFLKTNKAVKLNNASKRTGVTSLKEMAAAMKEMPQFQEMFAKYSLHIRLAGECMDNYKGKELEKIATVEQDLATGQTSDGRSVKKSVLIKDLSDLLQDRSISDEDKMRLLITYIGAEEGKASDREELIDLSALSNAEKKAVEAISLFTDPIEKGSRERVQMAKERKKGRNTGEQVPYAVSRYVPVLKRVLQDMFEEQLSKREFPYLGEEPRDGGSSSGGRKKATSLKSASRKRTASKGKERDEEEMGPRVIVFIAGGVTYSEVRSAYELTESSNREVIIGGSSLLTPKKFLEGLTAVSGGPSTSGSNSASSSKPKPPAKHSDSDTDTDSD